MDGRTDGVDGKRGRENKYMKIKQNFRFFIRFCFPSALVVWSRVQGCMGWPDKDGAYWTHLMLVIASI